MHPARGRENQFLELLWWSWYYWAMQGISLLEHHRLIQRHHNNDAFSQTVLSVS